MLDHLYHISSAKCVSDLGEGFIAACLGAFGDDVETVVYRILEGSLRTDKLYRFMRLLYTLKLEKQIEAQYQLLTAFLKIYQ